MAKYIARSAVDHDLRRYEIGETLELDDAAAAPLLAAGAIVKPTGKGKAVADSGEGGGDA